MIAKERIIQAIIDRNGYKSYLEIGAGLGFCFNKIRADQKTAVEPIPEDAEQIGAHKKEGQEIFVSSSDEYFETKSKKQKFDIILIDGLHHADQVEKDIVNSWYALKAGGILLLHDVHPPTEAHQLIPRSQSSWTGDVYKAFIGFREAYPDIRTGCLPDKYGLGWIQKKPRTKVEEGFVIEMGYSDFIKKQREEDILGYRNGLNEEEEG